MAVQRFIPQGAQELRHDDIKVVIYIGENLRGEPTAVAYSGRRGNPDFNYYFKTIEAMEARIEAYVNGLKEDKRKTEEYKLEKKAKNKEFKALIKVGVQLRTTFSYNMTFNDFYEVLEVKGNKVQLAELQSEWVSGDAGWTGEVACTTIRTGKVLEGKFTPNGLKINGRFASIVEEGATYYENHMD